MEDAIRAPISTTTYSSVSGTYFDPKNMQERLEKYAKECGLSNKALNRYIDEATIRAGAEFPGTGNT